MRLILLVFDKESELLTDEVDVTDSIGFDFAARLLNVTFDEFAGVSYQLNDTHISTMATAARITPDPTHKLYYLEGAE